MSIRLIAKELYRLQRETEDLEQRLSEASMDKQGELAEKLRKIKAERDRMRRVLDGSKDA